MSGQLLGAGLAGGVLRGAFGGERSIESVTCKLSTISFDLCSRFKGGGCFRDPGTVTAGQALLIETVSTFALLWVSCNNNNNGGLFINIFRVKCSCFWSSPRPSPARFIRTSRRAPCGRVFPWACQLRDRWIGARVHGSIDESDKMLCFCRDEA